MGEGVQTHSTVPCHYNMKKASSNRSEAWYRPTHREKWGPLPEKNINNKEEGLLW